MSDTSTRQQKDDRKDKLPERKAGQLPRNHDEYMEDQNKQIEAQQELELEQQQSSQDEIDAIANDTGRANHNVTTHCDGNVSEMERFETLTAIEVYGEKGMSRYEVAPGDAYLKIVMVGATHPEEAPAGTSRKADADRPGEATKK